MCDIKLFAKNEKKLKTQIQAVRIYIQRRYRDGIWYRKMWYVNKKKRKTHDGGNRPTKSRKNQNSRRKGNLQAHGNSGSGYNQTSGDERKKIKKEYLRRTISLLETKLH